MAKRKKTKTVEKVMAQKRAHEPKLTCIGFRMSLVLVLAALIAQLVMAFIVYPSLPARISAAWVGQLIQSQTVPAWTVFAVFPFGQIVLLVLALFSPKDDKGCTIMETGKACSISLLSILFTALQSSAFHLPMK